MSAEAESEHVPPQEQPEEHREEHREEHLENGHGDGEGDLDADAEHEVDEAADSRPRKKRRIIKTSDKKFDCPRAYPYAPLLETASQGP
jgi:hypothetical protein